MHFRGWMISNVTCIKCLPANHGRSVSEYYITTGPVKVLQAPSRTVGFTRRFHTFSSLHATNTSLAVVPQSPVDVHTTLHSRTLASQSHQNILASSLNVSGTLAGERRSVTPASLAAVGIHGIPRRGKSGGRERIVKGRGEGEVGLRLRRGEAESAPTAARQLGRPGRASKNNQSPAAGDRACRLTPYQLRAKIGQLSAGLVGTVCSRLTINQFLMIAPSVRIRVHNARFDELQARLCSPMYKYADINCTLVVCCHIARRRLYQRSPGGVKHSISTLTSHPGEPGPIPGRATGFSQVGIVPDDAVGRRVFSGISRFPRSFIPALLHIHLNRPPGEVEARYGATPQCKGGGEREIYEETPLISGIVRLDSHMRESGVTRPGIRLADPRISHKGHDQNTFLCELCRPQVSLICNTPSTVETRTEHANLQLEMARNIQALPWFQPGTSHIVGYRSSRRSVCANRRLRLPSRQFSTGCFIDGGSCTLMWSIAWFRSEPNVLGRVRLLYECWNGNEGQNPSLKLDADITLIITKSCKPPGILRQNSQENDFALAVPQDIIYRSAPTDLFARHFNALYLLERNSCVIAILDALGGGNRKSLRKPADQRHRPARFPHAKIRSDPAGDSTRIALVVGEQANRSASVAPQARLQRAAFVCYFSDWAFSFTSRPAGLQTTGKSCRKRVCDNLDIEIAANEHMCLNRTYNFLYREVSGFVVYGALLVQRHFQDARCRGSTLPTKTSLHRPPLRDKIRSDTIETSACVRRRTARSVRPHFPSLLRGRRALPSPPFARKAGGRRSAMAAGAGGPARSPSQPFHSASQTSFPPPPDMQLASAGPRCRIAQNPLVSCPAGGVRVSAALKGGPRSRPASKGRWRDSAGAPLRRAARSVGRRRQSWPVVPPMHKWHRGLSSVSCSKVNIHVGTGQCRGGGSKKRKGKCRLVCAEYFWCVDVGFLFGKGRACRALVEMKGPERIIDKFNRKKNSAILMTTVDSDHRREIMRRTFVDYRNNMGFELASV
ncbi:hypothetical protein PR048_006836 [Dryococelus australis]|uniref:Uncharacterized protein n=1 Tax=Dryococelus australis TaxID=614101 RepID=A0ABQ9IC23_9NEOP|nr:hypothetical protein PR048_006836 [Dryococelus australis]